ncbi:MAG: DUF3293 domain-containing protein [Acetobacteraceae bacterium]
MSAVPADLIALYEAALYRVELPGGRETLRLGAPIPPRLRDWIAALPGDGAAYLTACNPLGERQDGAMNDAAMARLRALVEARGWPWLEGEGVDPQALWPAEPSLLIGLESEIQARRLGRAFHQNALVWIDKAGGARLVLLRE